MGYELQLHLGEISNGVLDTNGRAFFHEVARIDLSGVDLDDSVGVAESEGRHIYLYHVNGADGDTAATEDCYGKDLKAFSPEIMLKALQKAHRRDKYRRYAMAIPLLEAFIAGGFHNPGVVCFGH